MDSARGAIGIEGPARRIRARVALEIAGEHVARGGHHFAPLPGAEHRVDFGELVEQTGAGALGQATGDDQPAQPAGLLELATRAIVVLGLTHRAAAGRHRC